MTTNEVMRLADWYANANPVLAVSDREALRVAVEALVAERDALRTERDTLRQVIEQQLLNAEPGYVLVPVEPTPEMRAAFHACTDDVVLGASGSKWAAMLAAAPSVAPEPREQQTQKSINLLRSALLRIEQAQSIHTAHALAESALRKWRSQNGEGHENCDV